MLGALTARPLVALALGVTFGLVRGLAILLGRSITSPAALVAFHRRFDAWREPVRRGTVVVQAVAASVAALITWGVSIPGRRRRRARRGVRRRHPAHDAAALGAPGVGGRAHLGLIGPARAGRDPVADRRRVRRRSAASSTRSG